MKAFAAVLALMVLACSSDPGLQTGPIVPNVVGDTARAELKLGQMLSLDGITIRFVSVEEDSRCPTDVTCVWEGNLSARLVADGAGGERTIIVKTTTEPREVEYGGWTISIGGVSPEKHSERRIEEGEYTLRLVLARG